MPSTTCLAQNTSPPDSTVLMYGMNKVGWPVSREEFACWTSLLICAVSFNSVYLSMSWLNMLPASHRTVWEFIVVLEVGQTKESLKFAESQIALDPRRQAGEKKGEYFCHAFSRFYATFLEEGGVTECADDQSHSPLF
jgi:hypothetical protein